MTQETEDPMALWWDHRIIAIPPQDRSDFKDYVDFDVYKKINLLCFDFRFAAKLTKIGFRSEAVFPTYVAFEITGSDEIFGLVAAVGANSYHNAVSYRDLCRMGILVLVDDDPIYGIDRVQNIPLSQLVAIRPFSSVTLLNE